MPHEEEIWAPVPMLSTLYEVSTLGRVRNSRSGHILKPFKGYGKCGRHYLKVHLYVNGTRHCQFVHRLVAFAFYEVDHKNRLRDDCKLSNLEPVLRLENDRRWRKLDEEPPF